MVLRLSALRTGRLYLQGHSAIGRILCQWKIPMTPAGIEPATFRFVAEHFNHCATAVPTTKSYFIKLTQSLYSLTHISRVRDCRPHWTASIRYQLLTVSPFKSFPSYLSPTALNITYILESNPHPFHSFRGLKNQTRIIFAVVSWILEKW